MRRPGRRSRFSTNSHGEKMGSTTTLAPPTCRKNEAWPMKVTPIWPSAASSGRCVRPVRLVMAECRTSLPSWLAFLWMTLTLIILLRSTSASYSGLAGDPRWMPLARSAIPSYRNRTSAVVNCAASAFNQHFAKMIANRRSTGEDCVPGIGHHGASDGGQPGEGRTRGHGLEQNAEECSRRAHGGNSGGGRHWRRGRLDLRRRYQRGGASALRCRRRGTGAAAGNDRGGLQHHRAARQPPLC